MFDRVVVVDWSASSRPTRGRDSVWIAVAGDGEPTLENPPTRAAATDRLVALLRAPGRSLLAVDFSLGYPSGTAAALELEGAPWRAMWQLLGECVVDSDTNVNNRFAVAAGLNERMTGGAAPFWGCPERHRSPMLAPTKPVDGGPVGSWRTVESVLRTAGHRPFSSWQLLGAGAVGSQTLVGIPAIARIAAQLRRPVDVWPFTTGLSVPEITDDAVVVAEVWPSMFDVPSDVPVRDAAQVRIVADDLAARDTAGGLDTWFTPDVPPERVAAVVDEEGWVLGVPALFDRAPPVDRA